MTEQVMRIDIVAVVMGERGIEVEVEVEVGTVSLFSFSRTTLFCQNVAFFIIVAFFFRKLRKLICDFWYQLVSIMFLYTVYLLHYSMIIRTIYFVELYRWQDDALVLFYFHVPILPVEVGTFL